jgi:hypothetical protein
MGDEETLINDGMLGGARRMGKTGRAHGLRRDVANGSVGELGF